jgi:hypothetical protein
VGKAVFAVAFILSAFSSSVALARGGGGGHFMSTAPMRGAPTVFKRAVRAPGPVVATPRFAPRTFERMRVPRG